MTQEVKLSLERETKRKVRYNDDGTFGPMYLPKEWFGTEIPDEVTISVDW